MHVENTGYNKRKIGIGIDTGGTFTDAVIFDFDKGEIIASAKALTTKEDLSKGILEALDALPAQNVCEATTVSLSTTLATNACVENKGGHANLILIGADERVFDKVGSMYGLTDRSKILFVDMNNRVGEDDSVNWSEVKQYCQQLKAEGAPDAIGIVQIFARERNAAEEKYAKKIVEEILNVPVVCGHELHNDLNVFRRGAETMLNAGLISVIKDFLVSIKKSMNIRDINTNVVIMRSDGTLMSEEFTGEHPVETLLCGPAASVIGAQKLAQSDNAVVVDMGGTTTDVAILENGIPVRVSEGVQVGQWRTFVKGVFIDTFGLGGDSGIHIVDRTIDLQTERFIPLCILAAQHPESDVAGQLERLSSNLEYHTQPLTDFFVLKKELSDDKGFSQAEMDLCEQLKKGPVIYSDAAEIMKQDVYTLNTHRLETEGYIMRAGLTPTDIMHIKGEFTLYDARASKAAARFAASCMKVEVEELCDRMYDEVIKKLYCNIVRITLERRYKEYAKNGIGNELKHMIELAYEEAKISCRDKNIINTMFKTDFDLVGIGAPIHVFLPEVAKLLGTKCIIPKEARVGNAVGAVAGNVAASAIVYIKPLTEKADVQETAEGENVTPRFKTYTRDENKYFFKLAKAIEWASDKAKAEAERMAREQGAVGDIVITVTCSDDMVEANDVDVYMGTTVVATAVGK